MPANELITRLLSGAAVPSVRYGDLERALESVGYMHVGHEGPYRTWKHPSYSKLLTLRDELAQPMYSKYIDKAVQHLRAVQQNGGF